MPTFKTLIDGQSINHKITSLAQSIAQSYRGKEVVLVGVLKGSYLFLADLSRELYRQGLTDFEVDFLGIESYGQDTESSKNPRITHDLTTNILGRHVLIVEDIIDTGYSLDVLTRLLTERRPASLASVVLLSKISRRELNINPDYIGFEVDGWIEGYGLDTNQKHRGRPDIVVRLP
jgi:hypoxanthine phosphoribosyltransferase